MPYANTEKNKEYQRVWVAKKRARRVDMRARENAYKTQHRNRARALIHEEKQRQGCVDCGEADPIVLDFDHKPGEIKFRSVANLVNHSRAVLMAEMKKCDVRCANCHRRVTYKRRCGGL